MRAHRALSTDSSFQRWSDDGARDSWIPKFLRPARRKDVAAEQPPNEASGLLPKPTTDDDQAQAGESGGICDLEDGGQSTTRLVLREFGILLRGSVPVILAYTLQSSLQTLSVVIVGRGAPEDLATAAFSYMFAMSTAWLIALGGTTALDTLCSSTFTGSKNPHDLGVLLQRSFIVLGLFYVPIAILWVFSEKLFLVLGQEAQIARDSARFLTCLIPGGLGYIYFEALKVRAGRCLNSHIVAECCRNTSKRRRS
jgi:multidrug resistance protein, MATE family